MSELPPDAAALLARARNAHGPHPHDRERVLHGLHATLGIGAAAAIAATTATTASATAAAAAAVEGVSIAPAAGGMLGWKSALLTWKAGKIMLATVAVGSAVGVGSATLTPTRQVAVEQRAEVSASSDHALRRAQRAAGKERVTAPVDSAQATPQVEPGANVPTHTAVTGHENADERAPPASAHSLDQPSARSLDQPGAAQDRAPATASAPLNEAPAANESDATRAAARASEARPVNGSDKTSSRASASASATEARPTASAAATSEHAHADSSERERTLRRATMASRRPGASEGERSQRQLRRDSRTLRSDGKLAATGAGDGANASTASNGSNRADERRGDGALAAAPYDDAARGEVTLLRSALASLRDGDGAQALTLLAEHAARYPSGAFTTERRGLRVLALCAAGMNADGQREQAAFLRDAGGSPIAARVRSACADHTP